MNNDIVATEAEDAYLFCLNVLKNRSEELEKIIINDPKFASLYAICVIKGRWTQAEPYITKNHLWKIWYFAALDIFGLK